MIVDKCMEIFFFFFFFSFFFFLHEFGRFALSYDEVIAKQRLDIEEQLTVNPIHLFR